MWWISCWLLELIRKKTVILITIQKNFFVKQIVSIFSPIRATFLPSILNLKNVKHLKKYKWRINAYSVASLKVVELLHTRRWEKRNRTDFYWRIVKVYLGNILYRGIETFSLLRYWNILSSKFLKCLNYNKPLCIIFYAKLI